MTGYSGQYGTRNSSRSGTTTAGTYSVGVAKVAGSNPPAREKSKSVAQRQGDRAAAANPPGAAHDRRPGGRLDTRSVAPSRVVQKLFGPVGRVVGVDAARGAAVLLLIAGAASVFAASVFGTSVFGTSAFGSSELGTSALGASAVATPSGLFAWLLGSGTTIGPLSVLDPGSWLALLRPGALSVFAVLALAGISGTSASLLSGGYEGTVGLAEFLARTRVLVRVILFGAFGLITLIAGHLVVQPGTGLPLTGQPAVVPAAGLAGGLLLYVSVMSLAEVLLARCGSALLFTIAAGCALIAPVLTRWLSSVSGDAVVHVLTVFVPWACLFLAGMAVGRSRLDLLWVRFVLLSAGIVLAAAGFGAAWAVQHFVTLPSSLAIYADSDSLLRGADGGLPGFIAQPPSVFVVVGVGGILLALVAAFLLVGRSLRWLVLPFAAAGSLALSVGALIVVAACVTALAAPGSAIDSLLTQFADQASAGHAWLLIVEIVVASAILATLWRLAFGSGPLERLVAGLTKVMTRGTIEYAPIEPGSLASAEPIDALATDPAPASPDTAARSDFEAIVQQEQASELVFDAAPSAETPDSANYASALAPPAANHTTPMPPEQHEASHSSSPLPSAAPPAPAPAPATAPAPAPADAPAENLAAGQPATPQRPEQETHPAPGAHPDQPESPPPAQQRQSSQPAEPQPRTPPTISAVRSTWSPGQSLGRLPY